MKLHQLALGLLLAASVSACQSISSHSPKFDSQPQFDGQNQTATLPLASDATALGDDLYTQTLDNGLTVIIKKDVRAPIVMTQIWYDVGSMDEPLGKGGISHFLEHMMFKDAKGVSATDYQRLISHFGGNINAFTSSEYTAYYESLPANQYPLALQIEANRMTQLILNADEVATEKEVIKEERRLRVDDNPLSKAYEEFLASALPDSPLGRPVIGSMADIDGISLEDLQAWYRQWYTPNNATLVMVGDINANEAMEWINKYFGDLKPGDLPARPRAIQTSHRGYQKLISHQTVQVPSLIMGFNVPTLGSGRTKEAHALSLLADVADGGLSARFERRLIRQMQLLNSVSISYDMLSSGDGLFVITATPRDGVTPAEAETAILEALKEIYQGEISDQELARSRTGLLSSLVFASDSIDNQASTLGALSSLGLPLDTIQTLPQALDAIKKSDIKAVGQAYLTKDNLTTMLVLPKAEP